MVWREGGHNSSIKTLDAKKHESSGPEVEISEKELVERMDRLRAMGRIIGRDFAMKVEIGKERGWKYKFKPVNTIEVDPEDVGRKGLDYCFGLIAHEGAHRRVSRMDFISKEQWQESGFSFLMNAVEDPRVNNWVGKKYEGAAKWLEQVYEEDMPVEGRIDAKAKEKLSYTPKHIQYGLEVIRYWHTGKFSEDLPEDIHEVLKSTIADAEKAYGILPGKEPAEDEIVKKAKLMFGIVRSKIWPEYKKLVDKSVDDETLRQIIKDMIKNGELKPAEKEGEPMPLDQMPDDLRKEIEKKLKEKLDGMSEKERDTLLTAAEAKAKQTLGELESDLNKTIRGKFSDQPETKTEEKARVEAETKEAEEAKKRAKELAEARKEFTKKLEAEKDDYQRAYEEVKPYIDKVAEDLMNIFIAKRFPQFRRGFSGQKLRLKGAMKYEGRRDYKDLFERRQAAERPDYRFLLLVDLSGSMGGQKIEETFKGAVLFAEALAKVGATLGAVKVAIYGFQNKLIHYKDFDSELDDKTRKKMSIMKKEVYNQGEHNQANYNNDGYCVDKASTILREQEGAQNFLVVLSDGQPAGDDSYRVPRYTDLDHDEELMRVVKDISEAGDQYVLGVGLGAGTEHVSRFYKNDLPNVESIPNVNIKKLSEVLAGKLQELIK
jgi:uncharacterized protein YegL/ribosomal protein L22